MRRARAATTARAQRRQPSRPTTETSHEALSYARFLSRPFDFDGGTFVRLLGLRPANRSARQRSLVAVAVRPSVLAACARHGQPNDHPTGDAAAARLLPGRGRHGRRASQAAEPLPADLPHRGRRLRARRRAAALHRLPLPARGAQDSELPAQTHGNNRARDPLDGRPGAHRHRAVRRLDDRRSTTVRGQVATSPAVIVDVTGFQWQWTFDYPEQRLSLHRRRPATGPRWSCRSTSRSASASTPTDVIHSFYVPAVPLQEGRRPGPRQRVRGHRSRRRARTAASAPSSAAWPTPTCTSRSAP